MLNVKPKDGTLTEVLGFQHMLMITIKPATPTGQAISYGLFWLRGGEAEQGVGNKLSYSFKRVKFMFQSDFHKTSFHSF